MNDANVDPTSSDTVAGGVPPAVHSVSVLSAEDRPIRDLEIIIPAYNEVERLPATLSAVRAHLNGLPLDSAIVVVDNGSVDRTVDMVARLVQNDVPIYVLGCDEQGKGAAVRRGVLSSRAAIVGFQDADLSTPLAALAPVLNALADGADVAIAVRRGDGADGGKRAALRNAGSLAFSAMAGSLAGTGDSQCGFKFFRRSAAEAVFRKTRIDGFAFDVEVLAIARGLGLRVVEVPVTWTHADGSTFRPLRDGAHSFLDLLRVHRRVGRFDGSVAAPAIDELRIVFVNWRDTGHPQSGGAERYAWELARRVADRGAQVTYLTAGYDNAPRSEVLDGVEIVRRGSTLSVYPAALAWLAVHRQSIDVVIDCQNGIPFFSPLALGKNHAVLLVVHHVHQDQFATRFSPGMAAVGRTLEGPVSRAVYRNNAIVAVSPSTRQDVRRRLRLGAPVVIVPNGTPETSSPAARRSDTPRIVCLGRLVPHKRVELLLHAAAALLPRWPDLQVDLVGDGPAAEQIRTLVHDLGLGDVVRQHGRVEEAEKADLLATAWLSVNTSMGEGWGITVMEAAAAGVPSLAFDVPGLRDSIIDGETGWLIPEGSSLRDGLDRALSTLSDGAEEERWGARARAWADCFSWDDSAARLAGLIVDQVGRVNRRAFKLPERRRTDAACVLEATALDTAEVSALRGALRSSDIMEVSDDRACVLLHGCDERSGHLVAARIGLAGRVNVRAARQRDLLTVRDVHVPVAVGPVGLAA